MIDENLARSWVRAFAPPPIVAPSSFAENEINLPGSANAIPGPLRLAPYHDINPATGEEYELRDRMLRKACGSFVLMRAGELPGDPEVEKSLSLDGVFDCALAEVDVVIPKTRGSHEMLSTKMSRGATFLTRRNGKAFAPDSCAPIERSGRLRRSRS